MAATFRQSEPSLGNGGTLPANAGTLINKEEWGIDNTLAGFIVQSEEITTERITDTTQDQKGAVVSQLDYDEHYTLTLGVIGDTASEPPAVAGDITFEYAGAKWKVQSCQYTGEYNAKKRWQITAERWHNFPSQS